MTSKKDLKVSKEDVEKAISKNLFLKIWKDSVFSKLIASGILISLPFISTSIYKLIEDKDIRETLSNFLDLDIKLYTLLIISISLIIIYFIYLKVSKRKQKNLENLWYQKVGNYRFGDLNNILLTTYMETPPEIRRELGINEIDLLRLFLLYIPRFNMGVEWDEPGPEGIFLSHKIGPKLISYGLCELTPSLKNNQDGEINSYDIFTSEIGYLFFSIYETYDRKENTKSYLEEFEEKRIAKNEILDQIK